MPPELISDGTVSKAIDVYAFGVILWEMCAAADLFPHVQT